MYDSSLQRQARQPAVLFECPGYPCKYYDSYDALMIHRNQRKDLQKAKEIGIEAYLAEQHQKVRFLNRLPESYGDGQNIVFYCAAVNMLSVDDIGSIIDKADSEAAGMALSDRAEHIISAMKAFASRYYIKL